MRPGSSLLQALSRAHLHPEVGATTGSRYPDERSSSAADASAGCRLLVATIAAGFCQAAACEGDVSQWSESAPTVHFALEGTWESTGGLAEPRSLHNAVLVPSGRVLVVGGGGSSWSYLASAEEYDPVAGTWVNVGSLATGRNESSATLLQTGEVLVAGGWGIEAEVEGPLSSCELYDPHTRSWHPASRMAYRRSGHVAVALPSGDVLVAGGTDSVQALASAELYDARTDRWTEVAPMADHRRFHTATLLLSGMVLVVGGVSGGGTLSSAELWDPTSGSWQPGGTMAGPRDGHSATLLPDGTVLVAGGGDGVGSLASAEIFDPAAGRWTTTSSMPQWRRSHTATLLPTGLVLVAGGAAGTGGGAPDEDESAVLYDPATGRWSATDGMDAGHILHTATLLPSGRVLVAGGYSWGGGMPAPAELYDSGTAAGCRVCQGSGTCVDVVCDDDNPCTTDSCDPGSGCVLTDAPEMTPCDDGNACTSEDGCFSGLCTGGGAISCEDSNPCTVDSCDPVTGCSSTATAGEPCDDGDDSTADDICGEDGSCVGTPIPATEGCGCRAAGESNARWAWLLTGLACLVVWLRRTQIRRRGGVADARGSAGPRARAVIATVVVFCWLGLNGCDDDADPCQATADHCTACGIGDSRDGCSDAFWCVEHPDDPRRTPGFLDWIRCIGEVPCEAFTDGTVGDHVGACCAASATGCAGV